MIYPYRCEHNHEFEVTKSVRFIDDPENCPTCGKIGVRYISRTHFFGASDWDTKEFNRGLGIVTRNKKHRDREAKARGLIEIGNENIDKFMDSQDKKLDQANEERSEKALEGVVYGLNEELRKAR